jgi:hypothetical protein
VKGATLRRLDITDPASTSASFTAEYFNSGYSNTSTFSTPITDVSDLEYWTLDRAVTTDQVKINLYWEDATSSKINDCSDLTIAHWNGSSWIEEAATATGSCSGSGSGIVTTTSAVSSYSPFTFGSKSSFLNPLPVKLLSFKGFLNENKVDLIWKTATEINNDYFTLQKSKDGITFEDVMIIKGAGNSAVVQTYTATDYEPYKGITYFRLKQTDYDEKFEYSTIIAVHVDIDDYNISVFPNPAVNIINITWPASEEVVQVRLTDSQNKTVYEASETGYNSVLDVSTMPEGIYVLAIQTGNKYQVKKIIVKK